MAPRHDHLAASTGSTGRSWNRRAWDAFGSWEKPFLTAFSDKDPITRGGDRVWQKHVPGARGQHHVTIEDAGHFLQEDKGEELANLVIEFIETNR